MANIKIEDKLFMDIVMLVLSLNPPRDRIKTYDDKLIDLYNRVKDGIGAKLERQVTRINYTHYVIEGKSACDPYGGEA